MLFTQLLDIRLPAPYDVRPSAEFARHRQRLADRGRWVRRRRPMTLPPWKLVSARHDSWLDARRRSRRGGRG
ncbi:hypothetical protein ACQPZJ_29170 [Actinoplanes sp. CA-054009]